MSTKNILLLLTITLLIPPTTTLAEFPETTGFLGQYGEDGTDGLNGPVGSAFGLGGFPSGEASERNGGDGENGGNGGRGGHGGNGGNGTWNIWGNVYFGSNYSVYIGGDLGSDGQNGVSGLAGGNGGNGGFANWAGFAPGLNGVDPTGGSGFGQGSGITGVDGTDATGAGCGGGGGSSGPSGFAQVMSNGGDGVGCMGGGSGTGGTNGSAGASEVVDTYGDYSANSGGCQIGGRGGRGGRGGDGGNGGGGGGGAGGGGNWPAGNGGSGGAYGYSGSGGNGGEAGTGIVNIQDGAIFTSHALIEFNWNDQAALNVLSGGTFNNHSEIQSHFHEGISNYGTFKNNGDIYGRVMNYQDMSGDGSFTILENQGTFSPGDGIGLTTVESYNGTSRLLIQIAGTTAEPLSYDVLYGTDMTHLYGEVLVLEFVQNFDEADLNFGDSFDIVQYYDRSYVLPQFQSIDDTLAPLTQGSWDLNYIRPQNADSLNVIQLVYLEDLSPVQETELPRTFALNEIYPNPFNPRATISYDVPNAGIVRFNIFDLAGRQVWSYQEAGHVKAGHHQFTWNGTDMVGRNLPSGTYLLRMEAEGYESTRQMMLIR